jgi:hypothetical protein
MARVDDILKESRDFRRGRAGNVARIDASDWWISDY